MGAVDFGEWAAPALELTYKKRSYFVEPPTVDDAKKLLAAAVRGEVNLGLVKGDIPDAVREVLATIGPDEHPALGAVYEQLLANKVPQQTIDRMAYYATFYWARGKEYADWLAVMLFTPRELAGEGSSEPTPKG